MIRTPFAAAAALAFMAGAAHAEEITDKTRCTAFIAALSTDQRAKIRPYVLYVLNAMEAMDSDNTQRGDPGIMAAMSDEGRLNMAVGADMGEQSDDEPEDEGDQQQCRHPLHPPVGDSLLGAAEAAHPAKRGAMVSHPMVGHLGPPIRAKPAMKASKVRTAAATTTVQPLA